MVGTTLDDGMRRARHLGGNRCQRLSLEIGVVAIPCDVALVLARKLLSRCRIAIWAAIQNARRSRALLNFDSLVCPQNWPD